jgi:hypothetical protein
LQAFLSMLYGTSITHPLQKGYLGSRMHEALIHDIARPSYMEVEQYKIFLDNRLMIPVLVDLLSRYFDYFEELLNQFA